MSPVLRFEGALHGEPADGLLQGPVPPPGLELSSPARLVLSLLSHPPGGTPDLARAVASARRLAAAVELHDRRSALQASPSWPASRLRMLECVCLDHDLSTEEALLADEVLALAGVKSRRGAIRGGERERLYRVLGRGLQELERALEGTEYRLYKLSAAASWSDGQPRRSAPRLHILGPASWGQPRETVTMQQEQPRPWWLLALLGGAALLASLGLAHLSGPSERALDPLEQLVPRVQMLLERGDQEGAVQAVRDLEPEDQIQGWLILGEIAEPGNSELALDAYARAWVHAEGEAETTPALLGVTRVLARAQDWQAVGRLLEGAPPHPELDELRALVALSEWRFAEAADLIESRLGPEEPRLPLLRALAEAPPQPRRVLEGDFDGDGRQETLLRPKGAHPLSIRDQSGVWRDVLVHTDRPVLDTWAVVSEGERDLVCLHESQAEMGRDTHRLYRLVGDTLEPVSEPWPALYSGVTGSALADMDQDGEAELYLAHSSYVRHIARLDRDGARWRHAGPGVPPVDSLSSDVFGIYLEERTSPATLIAGVGQWGGYQVIGMEPSPRGPRMAWRQPLGAVGGVAPLPGEAPRYVVSSGCHSTSEDLVGPCDSPAGLYLMEGPAVVEFLPAPRQPGPGEEIKLSPPWVSDLDGDGVDDLAVSVQWRRAGVATSLTWLLRRTSEDWAEVVLPWTVLHGVAELDGSPGSEVSFGRREVPTPPAVAPGLEPPGLRPVQARRWQAAEDLAQVGLLDLAAEGFAHLAPGLDDDASRAAAHLRAGQLYETTGQYSQAVEHLREAEDHPATRAEAAPLLLQGLLSLMEVDAALAVAREHGLPAPELEALAREPWTLDGASTAWTVDDPLAARTSGSGVELTLAGEFPPALRTSVVRTGGPVRLSYELTVDHLDWGAAVGVALARPDDEMLLPQLPTATFIQGGGGRPDLVFKCGLGSDPYLESRGPHVGRIRWDVAWLPERGEVVCRTELEGAPVVHRRGVRQVDLPVGVPLELRVDGHMGHAAQYAHAWLGEVRVWGLAPGPPLERPAPDFLAQAMGAWQDGELEEATALVRHGVPAHTDPTEWADNAQPDPRQSRVADLVRTSEEGSKLVRRALGDEVWAWLLLRDASNRAANNNRDYEQAEVVANRALEAAGAESETLRARLLLVRAEAYEALGDQADALGDLEEIIRLGVSTEQQVRAHREAALLCAREGDEVRALEHALGATRLSTLPTRQVDMLMRCPELRAMAVANPAWAELRDLGLWRPRPSTTTLRVLTSP